MRLLALIAIAIGFAGQTRHAAVQTPVVAFDVVSVKPHVAIGNEGVRVAPAPGGRLTITNASLRLLIMFACRIQDSQLLGGPEWADKDTCDITARADRDAPGSDLFVMLRPLLADRFKVTVSTRRVRFRYTHLSSRGQTRGLVPTSLQRSAYDIRGRKHGVT